MLFRKSAWIEIIQSVFLNSPVIGFRLRSFILRLLGHRIGMMYPHSLIGVGKGRIFMGKGTFSNRGCFFDTSNDIVIGDNVSIGMNVCFITSTHEIGGQKRASTSYNEPIKVENGCWIGANVTILPGVTIHQGCVVAAGAVVTKDCDPNCIYAGVPARIIKRLSN